jgi:hypothetical protein
MSITEQDLRALVRRAIAARGQVAPPASAAGATESSQVHASHLRFALERGDERGGPCLIEPAVPCTHCGYCQSFGH